MKFLSRRRFNYIDGIGLCTTSMAFTNGRYLFGFCSAILTLVASLAAEAIWGKE